MKKEETRLLRRVRKKAIRSRNVGQEGKTKEGRNRKGEEGPGGTVLWKLRRPSPTLERLLEIHEALQFQGFFFPVRLPDPPSVGRCVTIKLHLEPLPRSSGRGLPGFTLLPSAWDRDSETRYWFLSRASVRFKISRQCFPGFCQGNQEIQQD